MTIALILLRSGLLLLWSWTLNWIYKHGEAGKENVASKKRMRFGCLVEVIWSIIVLCKNNLESMLNPGKAHQIAFLFALCAWNSSLSPSAFLTRTLHIESILSFSVMHVFANAKIYKTLCHYILVARVSNKTFICKSNQNSKLMTLQACTFHCSSDLNRICPTHRDCKMTYA